MQENLSSKKEVSWHGRDTAGWTIPHPCLFSHNRSWLLVLLEAPVHSTHHHLAKPCLCHSLQLICFNMANILLYFMLGCDQYILIVPGFSQKAFSLPVVYLDAPNRLALGDIQLTALCSPDEMVVGQSICLSDSNMELKWAWHSRRSLWLRGKTNARTQWSRTRPDCPPDTTQLWLSRFGLKRTCQEKKEKAEEDINQ